MTAEKGTVFFSFSVALITKMLFWGGKPHASDYLVTACESPNYQIQAMERMEFIVSMHSMLTPTVKYADIILPAQDWMWEEKNITISHYGGFECINYCPGVVKPPGEVKAAIEGSSATSPNPSHTTTTKLQPFRVCLSHLMRS